MTRFLFLTTLLLGAATAACWTPLVDTDDPAPASAQAQPDSAWVAFEVSGMKKTKSGAT